MLKGLHPDIVVYIGRDQDLIKFFLFRSFSQASDTLGRDDQDKDEDPSARSDRGTKRRKYGNVAETSKDSRSKEKKSSSTSKDASHHKFMASLPMQRSQVTLLKTQECNKIKSSSRGTTMNNPLTRSQVALAEEPPTSFDEFNDTSFDFSAFVMNQLKIPNLTQEIRVRPAFNLLKGTCKSITELEYHLEECSKATTERLDWHNPENKLRYSTSVTKTKAATYELKWIEDLVHELWSPVVVKYDQHAYCGASHWGPKSQSFYGYASNLTSSKVVYSRRRIIAVTRLTIMKKYDYGHLEEIEVRRDDQQLYTFKEGDFKRLRLQDIKDMLLLLVQQKLTNLTIDERYDLNVALYPHEMIYVDQFKRRRLMRADELHKFSDDILNDVRSSLHDITVGIRMEYLPMRKWSNLEKKMA
ncbi:hypothetical protein Tco_0834523 [Tanacetum coccineum]